MAILNSAGISTAKATSTTAIPAAAIANLPATPFFFDNALDELAKLLGAPQIGHDRRKVPYLLPHAVQSTQDSVV